MHTACGSCHHTRDPSAPPHVGECTAPWCLGWPPPPCNTGMTLRTHTHASHISRPGIAGCRTLATPSSTWFRNAAKDPKLEPSPGSKGVTSAPGDRLHPPDCLLPRHHTWLPCNTATAVLLLASGCANRKQPPGWQAVPCLRPYTYTHNWATQQGAKPGCTPAVPAAGGWGPCGGNSCHAQLHQKGLPKCCWQQAWPATSLHRLCCLCYPAAGATSPTVTKHHRCFHSRGLTTLTWRLPACVATKPDMRGVQRAQGLLPSNLARTLPDQCIHLPTSRQPLAHPLLTGGSADPQGGLRSTHRTHQQSPTQLPAHAHSCLAVALHPWLTKQTSSCTLHLTHHTRDAQHTT
jgi:hypothetical protein